MDSYTCPICKKVVEKDLMIFLKHTDTHILEVIKKEHPAWIHKDGTCAECLDYYKKNMNHPLFLDEGSEI